MNKHTPGPWIVYEFVDGYDIRAPEEECWVVTASDPEAVWGAVGREEDACLIAAAPELLEALEKMVGLFEPGRIYDFKEVSALGSEALKTALAAIAKAKGEE